MMLRGINPRNFSFWQSRTLPRKRGHRSWAGVVQYPSEFTVPNTIVAAHLQLPIYTDGLLCQLDPSQCQRVLRTTKCMKKHCKPKIYAHNRRCWQREAHLETQKEMRHGPLHIVLVEYRNRCACMQILDLYTSCAPVLPCSHSRQQSSQSFTSR
jgi:hypothetical protein